MQQHAFKLSLRFVNYAKLRMLLHLFIMTQHILLMVNFIPKSKVFSQHHGKHHHFYQKLIKGTMGVSILKITRRKKELEMKCRFVGPLAIFILESNFSSHQLIKPVTSKAGIKNI